MTQLKKVKDTAKGHTTSPDHNVDRCFSVAVGPPGMTAAGTNLVAWMLDHDARSELLIAWNKESIFNAGTPEMQRLQNKLSADRSCLHRKSHRDKKVAGEKIGE
jgi:hypothetical protein